MYYILAILGFSLLIIVHELGHFIMAKVNGVRVEEFSIGMGPKLFKVQGKETLYTVALFPIGGFVKMMGEEEEVQDERSFSSKSPLRRISIIIAGAFMNFVLAIVIFIAFFNHYGYPETSINNVQQGHPAQIAGVMAGDVVTKVNGSKILTQQDLVIEINMAKGKPVDIEVDRAGEKKEFTITPTYLEDESRYIIGANFDYNKEPGFVNSFKYSFKETGSLVSQTFKSIGMIFTGEANLKTDVGGPVTIIKMSAGAAKVGIWNLLYLVGILSVSIAIFNMLPFPALDGGWTIILLIELITRRKVPDKIVGVLNTVGFMLLIGLMIVVTIKDILFPIVF